MNYKTPDLVFGNKWMTAAGVSECGFYLWDCPQDDHIFGSPFIEPVKIRINWTNGGQGVQQGDLFRTGDPSCYKLRKLPGRFAGPLQADHAGLHSA